MPVISGCGWMQRLLTHGEAGDPVLERRALGEVDVQEVRLAVAGIERQPQRSPLAVADHVEVGAGGRQQPAVQDHADLAGVLLGEEQLLGAGHVRHVDHLVEAALEQLHVRARRQRLGAAGRQQRGQRSVARAIATPLHRRTATSTPSPTGSTVATRSSRATSSALNRASARSGPSSQCPSERPSATVPLSSVLSTATHPARAQQRQRQLAGGADSRPSARPGRPCRSRPARSVGQSLAGVLQPQVGAVADAGPVEVAAGSPMPLLVDLERDDGAARPAAPARCAASRRRWRCPPRPPGGRRRRRPARPAARPSRAPRSGSRRARRAPPSRPAPGREASAARADSSRRRR